MKTNQYIKSEFQAVSLAMITILFNLVPGPHFNRPFNSNRKSIFLVFAYACKARNDYVFSVISCKAPEKKHRPLSATRKSKQVDKMDDNAEEIFRAMAEENQSVGKKQ